MKHNDIITNLGKWVIKLEPTAFWYFWPKSNGKKLPFDVSIACKNGNIALEMKKHSGDTLKKHQKEALETFKTANTGNAAFIVEGAFIRRGKLVTDYCEVQSVEYKYKDRTIHFAGRYRDAAKWLLGEISDGTN